MRKATSHGLVVGLILWVLGAAMGCSPSPQAELAMVEAQIATKESLDDIPTAHRNFDRWCALLGQVEPQEAREAVVRLTRKITENDVVRYVYTEWLEGTLYGLASPYRNEALFEVAMEVQAADTTKSEVERERPQYFLSLLTRNRIGDKAQEIKFLTPKGEPCNLSDFEGRRVLMLVLDPTCASCEAAMTSTMKNRHIKRAMQKGELVALAVLIHSNKGLMEAFEQRYGALGWQIMGSGIHSLEAQGYDPLATPSYYLLDTAGRVEVRLSPTLDPIANKLKK